MSPELEHRVLKDLIACGSEGKLRAFRLIKDLHQDWGIHQVIEYMQTMMGG